MKLLVITPLKSIYSYMQQRWCNRIKGSEKIIDAYKYNLQKCVNFLLVAHRDSCFGAVERERHLTYLVVCLLYPGTYVTTTLQVHENSR